MKRTLKRGQALRGRTFFAVLFGWFESESIEKKRDLMKVIR